MQTNETKHTPGPWHVRENHMAGNVVHLAILDESELKMPCSVTPMAWRRDEDDANAALIAKAKGEQV